MSIFRIDLNRLEDPSVALRKERRENSVFIVLAALFAALVAVASRHDAALGGKVRELHAMRADLKARIEALEKDSNYVSEEDVRALHDLDRRRVFWTRKLVDLAGLAGDKIVLTRVQYDGEKLVLQGLAETGKRGAGGPASGNRFELVSAFIDRVQASPEFSRDFRKAEFLSSHRLDFQDQGLISFEVACLPR